MSKDKNPLIDQFEVNHRVLDQWHFVRLRGKRNDDDQSFTWIDFEVFTVPAFSEGAPSFYATDEFEIAGERGGLTTDIDAAFPSVTGFVKGDGCTQMWFHDQPVHFDSEDGMQAMFDAIKSARVKALDVMRESGGTW